MFRWSAEKRQYGYKYIRMVMLNGAIICCEYVNLCLQCERTSGCLRWQFVLGLFLLNNYLNKPYWYNINNDICLIHNNLNITVNNVFVYNETTRFVTTYFVYRTRINLFYWHFVLHFFMKSYCGAKIQIVQGLWCLSIC